MVLCRVFITNFSIFGSILPRKSLKHVSPKHWRAHNARMDTDVDLKDDTTAGMLHLEGPAASTGLFLALGGLGFRL